MIEILTQAIVAIFAALLMLPVPTPAAARPISDWKCGDMIVEVAPDRTQTPVKPTFARWIPGPTWADDRYVPLPSRWFRLEDVLVYRGQRCQEIPYDAEHFGKWTDRPIVPLPRPRWVIDIPVLSVPECAITPPCRNQ